MSEEDLVKKYAVAICNLMPSCDKTVDVEGLVRVFVGERVRDVDEFVKSYMSSPYTKLEVDTLDDLMANMLIEMTHEDEEVVLGLLLEVSGLLSLRNSCNEIYTGLGDDLAGFLRESIKAGVESARWFFGEVPEEVVDGLVKLKKIMKAVGYDGMLNLHIRSITRKRVRGKELAVLSLPSLLNYLYDAGVRKYKKCGVALLYIMEHVAESGCRRLDVYESEMLRQVCMKRADGGGERVGRDG